MTQARGSLQAPSSPAEVQGAGCGSAGGRTGRVGGGARFSYYGAAQRGRLHGGPMGHNGWKSKCLMVHRTEDMSW